MALFDVSGFKPDSEIRAAGRTRLLDRTNHYSFGSRTPEFAVPVGEDVSVLIFQFTVSVRKKRPVSR